ncbi:MAG: hypothetical protein ACKO2P_12950 [Planctomycetota bacterium]
MNRKQFVAAAFAAAIPAYLLIASMVWALFQGGMLGDDAKVSAVLWVVFVIAALGGIMIGVLPFAVVIFPGLYPIAAAGPATAPGPASRPAEESDAGKSSAETGGDDEFGNSGSDEEFTDYADDSAGEVDDFDDFAEEAEEEPPQPKKKGRK